MTDEDAEKETSTTTKPGDGASTTTAAAADAANDKDDNSDNDASQKPQEEEEKEQQVSEKHGEAEAEKEKAHDSNGSIIMLEDRIRSDNWKGKIPVVVTLAPTSLSSPTVPSPIHVLVGRQSFLHTSLQHVVKRLHPFAPATFSFHNTTKIIVQEQEDSDNDDNGNGDNKNNNKESEKNNIQESSADQDKKRDKKHESADESAVAQENHHPDESSNNNNNNNNHHHQNKNDAYPVCWFEDEMTGLPLRWQLYAGVLWDCHQLISMKEEETCSSRTKKSSSSLLPWRIRLHFTNYPTNQLLELENHNNNNNGSSGNNGVLQTIQRTFKNALKQALVLQHGHAKVALNMTKQSHQLIWDAVLGVNYNIYKPIFHDISMKQPDVQSQNNNNNNNNTVVMIPIRVVYAVDHADNRHTPLVQKKCLCSAEMTLEELFSEWNIPNVQSWKVAGLSPPLHSKVLDLWRTLCHPDTFLYISVVATRTTTSVE